MLGRFGKAGRWPIVTTRPPMSPTKKRRTRRGAASGVGPSKRRGIGGGITGVIDDLIAVSGLLPADRLAFASAGIRVTLADEDSQEIRAGPGDRSKSTRKKAQRPC